MAPKEITDFHYGDDDAVSKNLIQRPIVTERSALLSTKADDEEPKSRSGSASSFWSKDTRTTTILAYSLLVQSYLLISVFPYSGFLAIHLVPSLTEETAGSYAGFIASAFMIGRCVSSFEWGKIADRRGRIFVLRCSFLLSAIVSVLFGLATSYRSALLLRWLLGLCNAIIGPIKTMVSEYADGNKTKETHMMAIVMGMWGYGFLINPAISGYLSDPIKQYPNLSILNGTDDSSNHGINIAALHDIFVMYPFLLPNILGCVLCLSCYWLVGNCLEETLPEHKRQPFNVGDCMLRYVPTCCHWKLKKSTHPMIRSVSSWGLFKHLHVDDGPEEVNVGNVIPSVATVATIPNKSNEISSNNNNRNDDDEQPATISSLLGRKQTRSALILYWFFSFLVQCIDEVFPLFCMSKLSGLGIEEKVIGKVLSSTGFCYILLQYFCVTGLSKRYGTFNALKIGMALCAPLVTFMPLSLLMDGLGAKSSSELNITWPTLIFVSFLYGIVRTFSSVVFSTCTILLNSSVPSHQRGTMNGLAMLGGSITKGCGPIFGGVLFSFCVNHVRPPYGSVVVYSTIAFLGLCQAISVAFFWSGGDDDDKCGRGSGKNYNTNVMNKTKDVESNN